MQTSELTLPGLDRIALVQRPDGDVPIRGGLVALHGASDPSRRQPLFNHLAETVTPLGYAVLSYDRRPALQGDVPLDIQAADAVAAARVLAEDLAAPVGFYAFSQGAWAACLAAAGADGPDFLALVGCSGVSPGRQMRYYTDQLLLRAGVDEHARTLQLEARSALEDVFRGIGDRAATAGLLEAAAREPWFGSAYLPAELPPPDAAWEDLDFDPAPVIARVACPTLLIHGADEECVPAAESVEVWRTHGSRDLTVVSLPGCGHYPSVGSAEPPATGLDSAFLSPDYTQALRAWFDML